LKGTYNNTPVAIKKIKGKLTEKQMGEFLKEAELTRNIPPHPNVIKCLGICLTPLLIVLEYCEGGSLMPKLKNNEFNLKQKIRIIQGIAKGMSHLRMSLYLQFSYLIDKNNIVHRDLAARNILLGKEDEPVISDFGFARVVEEDEGQTQTKVGPLRWMPPEALKNGLYSSKSDAWAFGVTSYLFEL
jgi:serine/threonine protein kinase